MVGSVRVGPQRAAESTKTILMIQSQYPAPSHFIGNGIPASFVMILSQKGSIAPLPTAQAEEIAASQRFDFVPTRTQAKANGKLANQVRFALVPPMSPIHPRAKSDHPGQPGSAGRKRLIA